MIDRNKLIEAVIEACARRAENTVVEFFGNRVPAKPTIAAAIRSIDRSQFKPALAQPGPGDVMGAARIWVRPQDMFTFKRDSDMVECRIVLSAAPPAGEEKP